MKLKFAHAVVTAFSIAAVLTLFQNCGQANFDVSDLSGISPLSSNQAAAPEIITQSADLTVNSGDPAVFSVTASGTGLQYEWYKDGIALAGNAATLTINAAQATDAGVYSVIISNSHGDAVAEFSLTVN